VDQEGANVKIIVLVKQVPDTWGERKLDLSTGRLDRDASDAVIDEITERAVEAALQAKDAKVASEVVALTMGPAGANDVLRKALSMGADSAIHILDDSLAGSDALWTAQVLAAAIRKAGFDLVIAGNESTDGRGGVIPAMLAELLGVPSIGFLREINVSGDQVSGVRGTDYGTLDVHAPLPAVVSVTEATPEARFPNFKGIMQAKKKPLEKWTVADLGVSAPAAKSVVLEATERPAREAGTKIVDEGDAGVKLAEFLAAGRHI